MLNANMAAKALIDSPEAVVTSAIDSLVSSTPHLERLDGYPDVSFAAVASSRLFPPPPSTTPSTSLKRPGLCPHLTT